MPQKALLTLGRLPKALELARALAGAGAEVQVADPWPQHLSKPSRAVAKVHVVPAPHPDPGGFRETLRRIILTEGIDLVIPVSEEILHVAALKEELGDRLFAPSFANVRRLHDKLAFANAASGHGLTAPETFRADEDAAAALALKTDYVLKPAHGCSGGGLSLRRAGHEISATERSSRLIVQRRIFGREISSFTVARDGRTLGTIVYKGLIFAGSVACCFERVDDSETAKEWIRDFIAAENYTGFIAFDFIEDANGEIWPIECNPRMTSGAHFMNPDDLADATLSACFQGFVRPKATLRFQEGHTALAMAYASISKPRTFARRLGDMARSEDVLFRRKDPLPFLLMTPMSWRLLARAMFRQQSFGEAATSDIAWPALSEATAVDRPLLEEEEMKDARFGGDPANDDSFNVPFDAARGT